MQPHFHTKTVDAAKYKKTEDGLLIREVYKNDSGEYTCKAFQMSSSGGDMKEHTTRLNIMREYYHSNLIDSS